MADGKNSILVVDDDSSDLMVLSHILRPEYTIYTAKNGVSALEKAKKYLPDLILLDILMPDMDGYEVLSALRRPKKTKNIPVIFVTGLNSTEDERKGLKLGAVDYIVKPFDDIIVKLRVALQIKFVNQLHTIERLSTTDPLTNIPNRRAFDRRLSDEWRRAVREIQPITIMIIDLDHFKRYNDKYGHQQGDKALLCVAGILEQTAKRPTDFAARWGGEEFMLLLSNSDAQAGLKVSENLRKNVERAEITLGDGTVTKITVSIGVRSQIPMRDSVLDDFISDADKALFTAKREGRNKVRIHSADAQEGQKT